MSSISLTDSANDAPSEPTRYYAGLYGSARSWVVAELAQAEQSVLVICKNRTAAQDFAADLRFFTRRTPVQVLSGWETIPFENVSPQPFLSGARLAALNRLLSGDRTIVVAPADALLQRVMPREFLEGLTFRVVSGEQADRAELEQRFDRAGYQRVSLVEEVGELAVHGNVIDCFSPLLPLPIRIEFDGPVIASIRLFDADSQRSIENGDPLTEAVFIPVRETLPFHDASLDLKHEATSRIKARGRELETPAREIARVVSSIRHGTSFPGIELLLPVVLPKLETVFDYLPAGATVVVVDDAGVSHAVDGAWEAVVDRESRLVQEHYLIPAKESLFLSPEEFTARTNAFPRAVVDHLTVLGEAESAGAEHIRVPSRANTELITALQTKVGTGEGFKPLGKFINRLRRDGFDVALVAGSEQRVERLKRLLLTLNLDAHTPALSGGEWAHAPYRYPVVILEGELSAGVQLPASGVAFIAEHEIFGERSHRKGRRGRTSLKRLLSSLALLSEGDFVVHTDYGIGLYRGLKHLDIEGSEGDFLQIEYADSTLYLPVQLIAKVQKFAATEGQTPALDKLGSQRWIKTKQKVRESVAALAGDLIKLYASRSVVTGWRFEPAGAEDERFADDFVYEETPDQLKAIEQTLADMAESKPMDRLVCGDVGFGKTEVALRAAYKAAQHAKQVAVLVPTTILAEQHYQTFVNRFKGWPVKVGTVSRFQTPQANKKTLEQLATGEIDIIVGTHRLLSKDVVFRDLGLVIIDEEHRFGVKQKERLKALKKQVDVLTLTATPIPRTLHMSLLGIRDISVISTPPTDRRVIRSYVASFDDALVRDVLLRELQRGGQAFFVHNRVQSIDAVAARLKELVPEARIGFAHGQMNERQLERIMQLFLNKELDVLVATAIIESGIDVPSANTMLIDRADMFGLAQLYQLRGRVGRSNQQAYCYFLIPKAKKLSGDAQQRLKALQALDDLGLGFNLALRDMEIRGAGNLLGKEQSGNVIAVGFELYSKILKEAILNLKGEALELKEAIDPEVKLPFPAFIPDAYVPDVSERLVLYQRFAAVDSSAEMDMLIDEVRDRFGDIPPETDNLAELMRFRSLLREFGAVRADMTGSKLVISLSPQAPIDAPKIFELEKKAPQRIRFGKSLSLAITLDEKREGTIPAIYRTVQGIFQQIQRAD